MKILSLLLFSFSLAAAADKPFVVHEWGTFTSFQDGTGAELYGLHRGDEPLPEFVYLRNPVTGAPAHGARDCHRNSYSCDWQPALFPGAGGLAVNQRMETPVIYFYSDRVRKVAVDVQFPTGIITEWYPRATSFAPAIGRVDAIAGGNMRWDVTVRTDRLALPPVAEDSVWRPSREVSANDLTVDGENERLIFYRGVGDFSTSLRVSAGASEFRLTNQDPFHAVPRALYLHVTDAGAAVRDLGPVPAGTSPALPYRDSVDAPLLPFAEYEAKASRILETALTAAGLYPDEARAMTNTWKRAYFRTPGERILYVLPRPWTDALLPLRVQPAPDQMERVMVGRIEVMNQPNRESLYGLVASAVGRDEPLPFAPELRGGFAEQTMKLLLVENKNSLNRNLARARPGEESAISRRHGKVNAALTRALTLLP